MIVAQIGIATLGVTAVYLSQDPRASRRRWSSVCGLCAQPFWIAETLTAEQYGILALTALYTWSWGRGFYEYWWKARAA